MKTNYIAFYSGSGIGLLIGVLMGQAISPTVGVIIGALSTVLAALLGLNAGLLTSASLVHATAGASKWSRSAVSG